MNWQDGGTPLPDAQILQANPEVQGSVIEQSFAEVSNTEEAEVAIDTEATMEAVDRDKSNDDMVKNATLQSKSERCP